MRASPAAGPGIVVTPRSASRLIMGGTSFAFPTAPSVQGDVLAYHVASAALLPTSRAWGIATTSTAAVTLANTTAATAGVTAQWSPALQWGCSVWNSGGSTATAWNWRAEATAISAATGVSRWALSYATTGAYTQAFYVESNGTITTNSANLGSLTSPVTFWYGNWSTGLGTTNGMFFATAGAPLTLIHNGRTDGANNIVHGTVYDRGAASITNATTMRLWSASWTNDANANIETQACYTDGSLWLSGANSYSDDGSTATGGVHYGAGLMVRNLSAVLTIAAAATTTSTVTIPAGAVVLGVSCRVTTVIPTAATFTIGHAGSAALWGTGISTAAGTTNTGAAVPALFATATAIVVTPNTAPADNTGRLRICIHYYLPTAPTS